MKVDSTTPHGFFVSLRSNTKLGFWLFLGGEVVFFTTLILTFILFRIVDAKDYPGFREHLSIPLIGVNTFILIASSYMVVRSLDALHNDEMRSFTRDLIAVIVLGFIFVSGQAVEWFVLFGEGVSLADPFGAPFFTITGIHGAHVLVGLVWALSLLFVKRRGVLSAANYQPVEVFGLYWHFVDIVWIVLFTLFYLI